MSFWRTYYHLIWATHGRHPWITPAVEAQLFPYLVQRAAKLEVRVLAINGWIDHIHLVVAIPPKHAVAEVVKDLKGASARYLNAGAASPPAEPFAWQEGYGVLTMGEQQCGIAIAYVQRQKEHHAAQHTNRWLERSEADDDGPIPLGVAAAANQRVVREESVPYRVTEDDDFPF